MQERVLISKRLMREASAPRLEREPDQGDGHRISSLLAQRPSAWFQDSDLSLFFSGRTPACVDSEDGGSIGSSRPPAGAALTSRTNPDLMRSYQCLFKVRRRVTCGRDWSLLKSPRAPVGSIRGDHSGRLPVFPRQARLARPGKDYWSASSKHTAAPRTAAEAAELSRV